MTRMPSRLFEAEGMMPGQRKLWGSRRRTCVAARGLAIISMRAPCFATSTIRSTATTISVFGWRWLFVPLLHPSSQGVGLTTGAGSLPFIRVSGFRRCWPSTLCQPRRRNREGADESRPHGRKTPSGAYPGRRERAMEVARSRSQNVFEKMPRACLVKAHVASYPEAALRSDATSLSH